MRYYISGAIASDPNFQVKFAQAQNQLVELYPDDEFVNPVQIEACPQRNCRPLPGMVQQDGKWEYQHTWACYMRHDLIELLKCDAVVALPDAPSSPGARLEMYLAGQTGLTVTMFQKMINWAKWERNEA